MKKTNGIRKLLLMILALQVVIHIPVHAESPQVYVSGEPVGIYIRTRGLLVLGTQELEDSDGIKKSDPSGKKLMAGDYILKADNQDMNSRRELMDFLKKNREKEVLFTIMRKGEKQKIRIRPVYSGKNDTWQIGAWVRSDTQGIGTITCICPDGSFLALGHGISDYDLGVPMDISGGCICRADISTVIKGAARHPGEIVGSVDYSPGSYLGSVSTNSPLGIRGSLKRRPGISPRDNSAGICDRGEKDLLPVASKSQVKKGKAFLRTSISGKSQDYTIKIEKIWPDKKDRQKTLGIRVTDERLLNMTGGIIQGLSGSPIIQEGKLAGAVTHVMVNDPARGYGILAEDMLACRGRN